MKKVVISIIPILLIGGLTGYIYYQYNNLIKENKKLYSFFQENEVLENNNNINLSSIKEEKDTIEKELTIFLGEENLNLEEVKNKIDSIKSDNQKKGEEISKLEEENSNLDDKIASLESQYDTLNTKYKELVRLAEEKRKAREREEALRKKQEEDEELRRSTIIISNFPTINQIGRYPTGCESVALTTLLKYYGVSVSVDDVINNLKKGELPYNENGTMYGGNPEIEFVGDPYSNASFGVYEKPIADVANMYKEGININNNLPFGEVLNIVKSGKPVMVWTSMYLAPPYISKTWIYKPTGETISWKAHEHAVVVVGYNRDSVIISDPLGGQIRYQARNTFESRYNYYGKKALYY